MEKERMMEQQQSGLVQNLYYYIQERVNSDWTTDAGMAVLLSLVTCGIYGLYVFYKLMERRDMHLARVANMVNTSVPLLKEKAAAGGKTEAIGQELAQLEMVQRQMYEQSRERGAVLWLILAIVTGVAAFIGFYFIMDDLAKHDQLEAQYFTLMSQALAKLGLSSQASQAAPNMPDRNFALYLVLSLVTCGIFYFYWLYVLVDDGNSHVEAQVQWEDFIYSSLAAA
jgi:amino acid transporter